MPLYNPVVLPTRNINTTPPVAGGGNLSSDLTIAMAPATSSVNGYLVSTDWATFNNKQNTLGFTPLNPANNLSDIGNIATARVNLKVGAAIFDHYADVNNSGTSETDLYTDTIATNTFLNNGDKIIADYGGIFTSVASATEDLRVYFAGTNIFDTGGLTISSTGDWWLSVIIIRTSTTTARILVSLSTAGASLAVYTNEQDLTSLNFATGNILKVTGQAGGAFGASSQITAKLGTVIFQPAA